MYGRQAPTKLAHAVGVALLAGSMYLELPEGGRAQLNAVLLAGLVHDVGELYIDPAFLDGARRLDAAQMKHIAAHPLIASTLLRDMPGAGPSVAEAVLHHHERLDGFGYPQGRRGSQLPVTGQVLAMAEMLMGIMEGGRQPAHSASVAVKLIPGEFNRALVDRIVVAARTSAFDPAASGSIPVDSLVGTVIGLGKTLRTLAGMSPAVGLRAEKGSPAFRELLTSMIERCQRIHQAFSSTGLDTHEDDRLGQTLEEMSTQELFEVATVLRELEWRLREVKREARRRAEHFDVAEAEFLFRLVESAKEVARRAYEHTPA